MWRCFFEYGTTPWLLSAGCITGHLILLMLLNNVFKAAIVVREMNECAKEFPIDQLASDRRLISWINTVPKGEPFGVIMLNEYALEMTLNWLCNTAEMPGVHNRTLFFTLDAAAEIGLKQHYRDLQVYRWHAPCLQADTFWRADLFEAADWRSMSGDVILDQQGFEGTGPARKQQMNGANFFLPATDRTASLIEDLHWYQTRFFVTDPDAVKILCNAASTMYQCTFIDHRIISGWEWVYGDQRNPPYAIQMDGETEGGKVETLRRYHLWFLNHDSTCNANAVNQARRLMTSGHLPRPFSSSKLKQTMLLRIGEFLNDLPLFGRFYRVYGGLPSLYLQFF